MITKQVNETHGFQQHLGWCRTTPPKGDIPGEYPEEMKAKSTYPIGIVLSEISTFFGCFRQYAFFWGFFAGCLKYSQPKKFPTNHCKTKCTTSHSMDVWDFEEENMLQGEVFTTGAVLSEEWHPIRVIQNGSLGTWVYISGGPGRGSIPRRHME